MVATTGWYQHCGLLITVVRQKALVQKEFVVEIVGDSETFLYLNLAELLNNHNQTVILKPLGVVINCQTLQRSQVIE